MKAFAPTVIPSQPEHFRVYYWKEGGKTELESVPVIAWVIESDIAVIPVTCEVVRTTEHLIVRGPNGIYRNMTDGRTTRELDEVREWVA